MTASANSEAMVAPTINPATRLGHVHYTVAQLEHQIAFYQDVLGFRLHWRDGQSVGLGAGGEDLLRLTEQPGARQVGGTTGLYHTAFLVPTPRELAFLLRSIAMTRTPIQGMSNHGTHHAIYLPDAEGNGIELAWDLPQEQWPRTVEEMLRKNRGLSPEVVFGELDDPDAIWDGLDPATRVGHVHLHVSELPATTRFYRDLLGFGIPLGFDAITNPLTESAMFFAAGDYHHHIGTNVWQGVGAPPPPEDATGLRYFTVVLPDAAELDRLADRLRAADITPEPTVNGLLIRDPAQNGLMLTTASA